VIAPKQDGRLVSWPQNHVVSESKGRQVEDSFKGKGGRGESNGVSIGGGLNTPEGKAGEKNTVQHLFPGRVVTRRPGSGFLKGADPGAEEKRTTSPDIPLLVIAMQSSEKGSESNPMDRGGGCGKSRYSPQAPGKISSKKKKNGKGMAWVWEARGDLEGKNT